MGKSSRFMLNGALANLRAAGLVVPTYRQVDYWIRTGRILTDLAGLGTGARRAVTVEDLATLVTVQQVLDKGFDLAVAIGVATAEPKLYRASDGIVTVEIDVDFKAQLAAVRQALSLGALAA